MKRKAKKRRFEIGDLVIVLSLVSSTADKPTTIFKVTGQNPDTKLYYLESLYGKSAEDTLSIMRAESCLIPAKRIVYDGPVLYDGKVRPGTTLTVSKETDEAYFCFESSFYPIPKTDYVKEVDI